MNQHNERAELPPLPEPVQLGEDVSMDGEDIPIMGYTADQLTEAVQEATARALKAAAMVCEVEARQHESLDRNGRSRHIDDAAVAKTCAAAIRNLIGSVK